MSPEGTPTPTTRPDVTEPMAGCRPTDRVDAVLRRRAVALRRLAAGLAQLAADADKSGLPDVARGLEALSPTVDGAIATVRRALAPPPSDGAAPSGLPVTVSVVDTDEFGHPVPSG